MNKLNLLITGSNGQLGSKFCAFLKKKKISYQKFELLNNNLNKFKAFTHIVHFKFKIKSSIKEKNKNLLIAKKISTISKYNNIKLIFISSIAAKYKKNLYGISKHLCEIFFRKNLKKVIILRPHNIYTDQITRYGVISELIQRMKKKNSIIVKFYKDHRDFLYYLDFFKAIIKACNYKHNGTFELGSGNTISIISVAKMIKKIFKLDCKIQLTKKKREIFSYQVTSNIKKAKKKLNWKPKVYLKKGLFLIKLNKNLTI